MLLRFSIQNYRSYLHEAELDFQPATALFGGNGSGKSNLIRALKTAVGIALGNERRPTASPFLLNEASRFQDSGLEFEVSAPNGTRFRYGLSLNATGIAAESLEAKPEGGKWCLVFARSEDAVELSGLSDASAQQVLGGLAADRSVIPLVIRGKDPLVQAFRTVLAVIRFVDFEEMGARDFESGLEAALSSPAARCELAAFLACIDPTVRGCRPEGSGKARTICLMHAPEGSEFPMPVPLSEESAGTRKMAALFFILKDVIGKGGVAVVDGLSSGLHPLLLREVVQLFSVGKAADAQLFYSTQDAAALADDSLSKAAVWLVEKDASGASSLLPLSGVKQAKKREGRKLEAAYLKGKLGGVPDLKPLRVKPKKAEGACAPRSAKRKGKKAATAKAPEMLILASTEDFIESPQGNI